MILKFTHINNLGRFRKFSCVGDQTLRKLNLIFGENGRGKTTIASVLRSLSTGDSQFLHERQTLGAVLKPEIEVLLDTGMAKFNDSSWSLTDSNIKIFDQKFVIENIHVGESVETNNKRGLASVILGQKGAEISKRIKEQDDLARVSLGSIGSTEESLNGYIPSIRGSKIMTLEEFLILPITEDIDSLISSKQTDLEAAQRAKSLKLQQDIAPLPIPGLPVNFSEILSQTLENVSADAEAKVRAHLKAAHMHGAEDWLSDGIEFMSGPTCPVCGRSVEGVDIITAYKNYFSEQYILLKDKVNMLIGGIDESLGLGYESIFNKLKSLNEANVAFWSDLIPSLSLPVIPDLKETKTERQSLLGPASMLIFKKEGSLLESLSSESLDSLTEKLTYASKTIDLYNKAVVIVNTKIAELKSKTASAKTDEIEIQLNKLKLIKIRYSSEVTSVLSVRDNSKKQREQATKARLAAQEELAEYSRAVVGACEKRINEILSDFGVGFKISGVDTTFPAGTAASTYSIEVNGEAVEVGKPRVSAPSFQTMLSAGDKSALALAFFFAILDQDASKASKIILLDDPFNSQDEHRRNQTNKLILKYAEECAQMLVSSHNPDFLRLIWDSIGQASTKCLKLTREGVDDTTIMEWDIEHDTKHPYLRLHEDLTKYMSGALPLAPSDVIQKPRPLLEDYIRFRFPNIFKWNQWLGDMILHFKNEGVKHPMHVHIQAMTDVNDYTSGTHHSSVTPINEDELRTHVKKTLEIVGKA